MGIKFGVASFCKMEIFFYINTDIDHAVAFIVIFNIAHGADAVATCIDGISLCQSCYVMEGDIVNIVALKEIDSFQEVDAIYK